MVCGMQLLQQTSSKNKQAPVGRPWHRDQEGMVSRQTCLTCLQTSITHPLSWVRPSCFLFLVFQRALWLVH